MLRKLLAVLMFAVTGLLMFAATALADPTYPAPPVVTVDGAPATGAAVDTVTDTATTLASTGAGFNVGVAVFIAVVVLVLGVGMVALGRRLRRSNNH